MDEEEVGLFIQSIGRFKTSFNDRLKHRCVEQKKIKLIMTQTQACNAYTLLTRGYMEGTILQATHCLCSEVFEC